MIAVLLTEHHTVPVPLQLPELVPVPKWYSGSSHLCFAFLSLVGSFSEIIHNAKWHSLKDTVMANIIIFFLKFYKVNL